MKKQLAILAVIITAPAVDSAPYIACDPYPPASPQPTDFVITLDGSATPIISPAASSESGALLYWDVGTLTGAHTITVRARNAWGESDDSLPFSFTAGSPAVPAGFSVRK